MLRDYLFTCFFLSFHLYFQSSCFLHHVNIAKLMLDLETITVNNTHMLIIPPVSLGTLCNQSLCVCMCVCAC
uniref:Secreted protein n=1 Tax=Octopus bimaculoides TaxID=37653 RepID=A0A0L8FV32_OCTBM